MKCYLCHSHLINLRARGVVIDCEKWKLHVEIASNGIGFVNSGETVQKLKGEHTDTLTDSGDLISVLSFIKKGK
jgi:hypothetical protein